MRLTWAVAAALFLGGCTIARADRSRGVPCPQAPGYYRKRVEPKPPVGAPGEGLIVAALTVTKTGTVGELRILESDPPGVFDRAVLEAIRQWTYCPKMVRGRGKGPPSKIVRVKVGFQ